MNKRATNRFGVCILLLSSWAGQANACRCVQRDLADYFSMSQAVMLVEILEVEQIEHNMFRPLGRHLSARFKVLETYKQSSLPLSRIKTAASSAACGLSGLAPGRRFWVFSYRQAGDKGDAGWIDTCSGSRPADAGFNKLPADQVAGKLRALSKKRASPTAADSACAADNTVVHTPAKGMDITRRIRRIQAEIKEPHSEAIHSPNGAYRYWLQNPNAIQRPPRAAKLIIDNENPVRLILELHNVQRPVDAEWINEKLIRQSVQSINFDVAISVAQGTETKGGVGLIVGAVALGSQGKCNASNISQSRI